jgi:hypothetical protein
MSEESSGGGLKNAIIGLVTIIVTALAGVIGKQMMGGDDEAPAPAVAPVIINLENNNTVKGGGSGGVSAPAPKPKKDDWTKAEPKW